MPLGDKAKIPGLEVIEVGTLTQALALLGLRGKPKLELLDTA
jgi:hypothetical protein